MKYFKYVLLAIVAINNAAADEILYSNSVELKDVYDPRHITFSYPDGKELNGVHYGVSYEVLWELEERKEKQRFNLKYSKSDGIVLSHVNLPITLKLIGRVENHPIELIYGKCLESDGGSNMGEIGCLNEYDKLLDVEMHRAYTLLGGDKNKEISSVYKLWEKFSKSEYSYMRDFYSKFSGSMWPNKNMHYVVEIDRNQLRMFNIWVEDLYAYLLQDEGMPPVDFYSLPENINNQKCVDATKRTTDAMKMQETLKSSIEATKSKPTPAIMETYDEIYSDISRGASDVMENCKLSQTEKEKMLSIRIHAEQMKASIKVILNK